MRETVKRCLVSFKVALWLYFCVLEFNNKNGQNHLKYVYIHVRHASVDRAYDPFSEGHSLHKCLGKHYFSRDPKEACSMFFISLAICLTITSSLMDIYLRIC